jgi:hypothetical protein
LATIGMVLAISLGVSAAWFKPVLFPGLTRVEARARGHRIAIEPRELSLRVPAGTGADFSVPVRNLTDQPLTIVGCNRSCTCISGESFPLTLSPGELKPLRFHVKTAAADAGKGWRFTIDFILAEDSPRETAVLNLDVTAPAPEITSAPNANVPAAKAAGSNTSAPAGGPPAKVDPAEGPPGKSGSADRPVPAGSVKKE